jgi:ATP:ADP antiporter, AAA family
MLGLRPEDRRDTAVGFGTLVALLAAHSMLETARDALFLEKLPPEYLPLAYIAIAVLALVVSRANQAALSRFSRRRLLSASLFVGGLVTALFWQLTAAPTPWMLGALYVWTGLLATVVVVQFWLQLGDVLDVEQAKRLFSLIAAGGLVGATIGSASAGALLTLWPPQMLLLVSGVLFVIASLVPFGFSRSVEEDAPRRRRHAAPPQAQSTLKMVTSDAYLKRLFLMVLIGAVFVTGVDYMFKAKVVAEAQTNGWNLGGFFARYYAVVNALSLVVQVVLAPRLMRVVGVNRALLLMPALMFLGAAGFAATIGLIPALLLKGTDGALRHSVHRTASEILYLPLPRKTRDRFKSFAAAVGQRGGQALASLIILGVTYVTSDARVIALGLVVLAAAWITTMVGLLPHYLELFRRQLRDGTLDTEVDIPDLDLASFETLVSALSSEQDVEVIAALDMFESYGKAELVPALILYHPSREVVMRAFDLFSRTTRSDVLRLTGRLLKHDDEAIRTAALRALTSANPDEELLRAQLEDGSPAVRCTALVAMIRAGFVGDDEAHEMMRKMVSGRCGDTRGALAQAARHLPYDRFGWVIDELGALADPAVCAELARSLASSPDVRFASLLVSMLELREPRADARSALLAIGAPALEHLDEAMADTSMPRMVRRHLPRTISRFRSQAAADVLMNALDGEKDGRVVLKILRGLGRMRSSDPAIEVDRERVLAVTQRTLEGAVTALHWRLTVGRVVALKQEAMTPAAELLVAYLDEKVKHSLQHVFRLLHVLEPRQEFRIIYDGLRSNDPKARASSRELLTHVVPAAVRDGILAMVNDDGPRKRLQAARSFFDPPGRELFGHVMTRVREEENVDNLRELGLVYADHLRAMLEDPSEALRSIVGYHVTELDLEDLITEVQVAAQHSSDVLGQVAGHAFGLFSIAPTPELHGAS